MANSHVTAHSKSFKKICVILYHLLLTQYFRGALLCILGMLAPVECVAKIDILFYCRTLLTISSTNCCNKGFAGLHFFLRTKAIHFWTSIKVEVRLGKYK